MRKSTVKFGKRHPARIGNYIGDSGSLCSKNLWGIVRKGAVAVPSKRLIDRWLRQSIRIKY